MGIYNNKYFLMEADELDSVQDPDNPGVDLDQVEKDIAGDDGIEAHSEEIEDAEEGVIEEPLEEMYNILYEAECNYNTLLKVIGINELNHAMHGRDYLMEAGDIRGFFEKVKEAIVKMFTKLTEMVTNTIRKVKHAVINDKKFYNKNRQKIISGLKKLKTNSKAVKKMEVYDFGDYKYNPSNSFDLYAAFTSAMKSPYNESEFSSSAGEKAKNAYLKSLCQEDVSSIEDMRDKLTKKLLGNNGEKVNVSKTGYDDPSKISKILTGDWESERIVDTYKKIKQEQKKIINDLKKAQKSVDIQNGNEESMKHAGEIAKYYCDIAMFHQKASYAHYAVYLNIAKKQRNQARAIAHWAVSHADKSVSDNKNVDESASIFGNIDFA